MSRHGLLVKHWTADPEVQCLIPCLFILNNFMEMCTSSFWKKMSLCYHCFTQGMCGGRSSILHYGPQTQTNTLYVLLEM